MSSFENWMHLPCKTDLKIAWPDSINRDDLIEDRMKYLAEDVQILYCPVCGQTWQSDDPVFREARRISRREVARWNRMGRIAVMEAEREIREMRR